MRAESAGGFHRDRGLGAALVCAAVLTIGCGDAVPALDRAEVPPVLAKLDTISVLAATQSFAASGVASDSTCALTIAGRDWGTLARIDRTGRAESIPGGLQTGRSASNLESSSGRLIVWAAEPALLAEVTLGRMDSIPIAAHAWGGRRVGPAVPLADGRIAVAPVSDRRVWVPSPEPWIDGPLIQIVGDAGVVASGGELEHAGGRYLTWLEHRAVLGARGDTVRGVTLSSGKVRAWLANEGRLVPLPSLDADLPRYFTAPEPREQVRSRPVLGVGGDLFVHWEVSHLVTAAFGGERIFAIRNYDAEWVEGLEDPFDPKALWRPTAQGLEVYDLRGHRLAAIRLPSRGASWIRADGSGRIFLGGGGSVIVARDPTSPAVCPPLPRRVELAFVDREPVDPSGIPGEFRE